MKLLPTVNQSYVFKVIPLRNLIAGYVIMVCDYRNRFAGLDSMNDHFVGCAWLKCSMALARNDSEFLINFNQAAMKVVERLKVLGAGMVMMRNTAETISGFYCIGDLLLVRGWMGLPYSQCFANF